MLNSIYIHIPFCNNICSYCDFAKIYYKENIVDNYLDYLENEIKKNYKNELIKTLYIGGGSPSSLNLNQLKKLFNTIKIFKLDKDYEFTIEINSEDMDLNKIKIFKENGINRVSIGVQSFDNKLTKILNRKHTIQSVENTINELKKNEIFNINIDLIYGLKEQTIESINNDLNIIKRFDITHVSYYSLILEPNTKLFIDNYQTIDEEKELTQYNFIKSKLFNMGFNHYEISNYSKKGNEAKHNLVYWNNNKYYGFGLGACGYIDNYRYENTKNIKEYMKGNYLLNKTKLSLKEDMDNEIMLGLRKLNGINKKAFKQKYNKNIYDIYYLTNLIDKNVLIDDEENVFINEKYLYISNEVIGKVLYGKDKSI